eukprot:Phypoly_transcript_03093.p1 GENE.Phypoly_transcript_03093~~Phypoly_transcript_03093.p1  ORF type:complete len:686 (+),score=106.19 Phypoly_transcript_03093:483-2540(+)
MRSTYLTLDPESDSVLTHVYQLLNSLKQTRAIFGLIAGVLRVIEEGMSDDLSRPESHMHDAVFEEFVALMRALGHNAQWRALVIRARTTTISGTSHPRIKISERPGYLEAERDMKQILLSLMGGQDAAHVDALFASLKAFWQDVSTNPVHQEFIADVQEVIEDIATTPEILDDPAARLALKVMYNSAMKMLYGIRANPNLQVAKDELKHIGRTINQDPLSRNLIEHLGVLAKDVVANDKRRFIDYSLIPQFRRILVPLLIETFREIRLPPIKGVSEDKKFKYHINNIVLSSIELLPENVKIETTYKINSDPLHLSLHEHDTIVWVEIERLRAHMKGTSWSYERLSFPRLKDEGLASVSLGGYGARVGLKLRVSRQGAGNILQVLDSYCVIDRLDVALYECNHKLLYKFFHHSIVSRLKEEVEKSVSDKLAQCVSMVDHRLMAFVAESKKQVKALNQRVASAKSAFKSSSSRKSFKDKISTFNSKRKLLQLVSKARGSAAARAPPYYRATNEPLATSVSSSSTTTVNTTVDPSLATPLTTTTTTTVTTTSSITQDDTPFEPSLFAENVPLPTPTSDPSIDTPLQSQISQPHSTSLLPQPATTSSQLPVTSYQSQPITTPPMESTIPSQSSYQLQYTTPPQSTMPSQLSHELPPVAAQPPREFPPIDMPSVELKTNVDSQGSFLVTI